MLVQQLFYIPVLVSLFSITIFIFSQSTKNLINIFFGLFTTSLFFWLGSLFFADTASTASGALVWTRVGLFFACLIPLFFFWFSAVFPNNKKIVVKKFLVSAVPTIILMGLALSSHMVQEVELKEYAADPTTVGTSYTTFFVYLVGYFGAAVFVLIRKLKNSPAKQKSQIKLVLLGTFLGVSFNVLFNFIFVILGVSGIGLLLGGPSVLIFVLLVTYAIVRHSLFDLRIIVARTAAYALLLGASAVIFAVLVITLPASLIGIDKPNLARQIYYTFSAVALAFAFQPMRRFFDRVTNNLFYRDAYDAQEMISALNQVIVSNIELDKMLQGASLVMEESLKPEYCVFGLRETDYAGQRIIGHSSHSFKPSDISFARSTTPSIDHKVIVADYLEDEDKELRTRMRKNDVAVLVRLTSDVKEEGIGYIVLGAKKSGNPYNSQDIRVLETIANSMVIAIENALRFEEIQKFNITLEQKVEDATRQLQRTNAKLVALDETKDDFISMASHQLRTPLTSVKGYLSMVLEGDAGKVPPKQQKLLDQAFISSQRMVYLIADLLNVSRLRTGKFVIEPKEVNLAEVIEGEVGQLKETAEAKGLELTYEKPKDFPSLMLDETKIRQVIMNFTDNAIYYTPSGGHITVKLAESKEAIEFSVTDDGIGVPKHEQHHLFTKFFRAANARKARPDGTGLGLFMAKKVVVAQGGAIIFKSHEGKGSTFGFTFAKGKLQPGETAVSETKV